MINVRFALIDLLSYRQWVEGGKLVGIGIWFDMSAHEDMAEATFSQSGARKQLQEPGIAYLMH